MVARNTFDKIPFNKLDVVELRKVKNMRFQKHGGGDIESCANVRQILEKMRVRQLLVLLVHKIFFDMTVRHQLCPNAHLVSPLCYMIYYNDFY